MPDISRPTVRRLTRRSLILGAFGTAGALALTGCGFGGVTAPQGSSDADASSLTVWIHGAGPFVEAHEQIAAAFEEENPGITIDLQSFPFADFNTRVVASLPAGQGPDVLEAYSPWMTGYIRTGLIDQVPEDTFTTDEITDRYYESPLSLLQYDGAYYGLPANLAAGSTRVLLANQAVVDEAGVNLDDNATFDDWIADWEALTVTDASGEITRSGLGQSCGQPADQFVSYLLEYGGELLSEDGKTSAFNDEAGLQALDMLNQLTNVDAVDSSLIVDGTCIPQGTAATGYRGTWVIPEYTRDFPDFDWKYYELPLPTGATEDRWQGGSGWATYVPEASAKKDLAWQYMAFLEDNRDIWIDVTGEIPADRELAAQVAEADPDLYGVYYPILEQSVHGYPYGDYFVVYQALSDMVTSVTAQGADPQSALDTAQSAIDRHLDQWWQQYP